MIKAVFFDLYNTLAHFVPEREVLQEMVCAQYGIRVNKYGIIQGYLIADDFMAMENARNHLAKRSERERQEFFAEYEQLILSKAGFEIPRYLAGEIFQSIRAIPYHLGLFEDAKPCLKKLKDKGLSVGLVTNIYDNVDRICDRLGIKDLLDFSVTSKEVQSEKPHPPIFLSALSKARVNACETMHVGDQYNSDVIGAQAVGITPILVDRYNLISEGDDFEKITGLMEVIELI